MVNLLVNTSVWTWIEFDSILV